MKCLMGSLSRIQSNNNFLVRIISRAIVDEHVMTPQAFLKLGLRLQTFSD
ncbi:hypothetical protein MAR_025605 [Mya arenaria]|uniref:Uncharacterized protein n=1 Tax=Mya arenaria TaxID=6604 RepID=A0ABY7EQ99_MYAAR|nr:hypothetical protein MAR_025605 [Mya arenaria]